MKIFSPEAYSWSTWPKTQPASGSLRPLCSPSNMHQTTNYHWSGPPAPYPGPPRPPWKPWIYGTNPNKHFCGRGHVRARQTRAKRTWNNLKWMNLWTRCGPASYLQRSSPAATSRCHRIFARCNKLSFFPPFVVNEVCYKVNMAEKGLHLPLCNFCCVQ